MKKKKYSNYINLSIIILILAFFLSCMTPKSTDDEDFWDFTEPEIESILPKNGQVGVDPFQDIKIVFNEPVDHDSVEGAFSLASSGETEGKFSWEGDETMIYSPKRGWTIGEKYTVVVERSVEDINRNKLQRKFVSDFFIGTDFAHPYIADVTNNPYIQENNIILTIVFSKSMDINSLQSAVSISPSFDYRLELNNNNTELIIIANQELPTMNEYTLTISTTAKSESGLQLLRDYVYDFAMYFDIEKPVITGVQIDNEIDFNVIDNNADILDEINDALDIQDETQITDPNDVGKNNIIIFRFNEEMDRPSVESAFNINPELAGKYHWVTDASSDPAYNIDILIFDPDIGFEQSETYSIFIENTAKDLVGNQLDARSNNYKLKLITYPTRVVQIVLNPGTVHEVSIPDVLPNNQAGYDPDQIKNDCNEILDNIAIDVIDLASDYDGNLTFYIYFNNLNGNLENQTIDRIDPVTLYTNINLTHQMGSQEGDPLIVSYEIIDINNRILVQAIDLESRDDNNWPNPAPQTGYKFNIYKLEIKGGVNGIKDDEGNYMQDTYSLFFRVNRRF